MHIKRTGDTGARSVNNLSKALQGLKQSSSTATKHTNKFLESLKRIAFYRVLRTIIKDIGKAFEEGLKNAYAFSQMINGQLAQTMNNIASLGMQMKNQLGASLGELLINLEPVITALENAIIRVADAMSRMMAVLGGRSTYNKAIASTEKFAEQTEKGAKAAKEWKNQLMGFDEINRLEAPSDTGAGSGGATQSIGNWEEAPAMMKWAEELRSITLDRLSQVNFEPMINAWGRLKEAISGFVAIVDGALYWAYTNVLLPLAQWTIEKGLPVTIGLLTAAFGLLNAVLEKISPVAEKFWNDILQPFAAWIGEKFTDVVGKLTERFESLTNKIEEANTLGEFIQSLDGTETIIVSIATAILGVAGALGLMKIATCAVTLLQTAFTLLASPIGIALLGLGALVAVGIILYQKFEAVREKFDAVGEKFSEFKERFNDPTYWGELGTAIVEAISTAIGAAIGAIAAVGKDMGIKLLEGLKQFFFGDGEGRDMFLAGEGSGLREIGGEIISGIFEGMLELTKDIGKWIVEHIVNPFIEGFKEAFGIHSPAKEMMPIGESISDGLLEGIKDVWKNIKEWVKTNIFSKISDALNTAFGITGDLAENVVFVGKDIAEGIKSGIDSIWGGISAWVNENIFLKTEKAFKTVFGIEGDSAEEVVFVGKGIANGIQSGISNVWSGISSWVNTNVATPLETEFNGIISKCNGWASQVQSIWSSIQSKAREIEEKADALYEKNLAAGGGLWAFHASGGFPEVGEAFIAREAGPELVGTIGGKTAVVNNQDIVAAVSQGVASAVASVMSSSNSNRRDGGFILNVNGREFMRAVYNDMKAVQNEKGFSLVNS